jgi:hypothetical protein
VKFAPIGDLAIVGSANVRDSALRTAAAQSKKNEDFRNVHE